MEILELIRLVSNPLNKISVDIISKRDVTDSLLLLSPAVIGVAALVVSYLSIKTAASTQRENSLTQARIEIATKLKYDRLNAIRDLASKLTADLDAFMMLSFRLKSKTEQIGHFKDNLKTNVSDLVVERASLFNEVFDKLRDIKTLSYKLQTHLDTKIHEDVIITIKRIEVIVGNNEPYASVDLFAELVAEFSRKMYLIIAKEWQEILKYPFGKSHK